MLNCVRLAGEWANVVGGLLKFDEGGGTTVHKFHRQGGHFLEGHA